MTRSGYSDDCENLALWRGTVASAIRGARGQKLLRDLIAALDAMPDKALIAGVLEDDNAVCALGAVGKQRGFKLASLDAGEPDEIAMAFNVAPALAREVAYVNDEWGPSDESPAARWARVRAWAEENLREPIS